MSKSFVSVGVTILDIVGYPIWAIPDAESTGVVQKIHLCAAGAEILTQARANDMDPIQAAHFASDGGVVNFATTEQIMQAGEIPAGVEA